MVKETKETSKVWAQESLNMHQKDCVKSVCIQIYSRLHSVQLGENTDQNNIEYGHFLPVKMWQKLKLIWIKASELAMNNWLWIFFFLMYLCQRTI